MPIRKALEYSKPFSFETDTLTENKAVKRDEKLFSLQQDFTYPRDQCSKRLTPREVLKNSCSYIIRIFPWKPVQYK